MPQSHESSSKPSSLLALVALALVQRARPTWVALDLRAAAAVEGVSAERVSRLCTRALSLFDACLTRLTRRGRPARVEDDDAARTQARVGSALLAVATSILAHVSLHRAALRALVVGAWLRLSSDHAALTQERFCSALALSPRTLRAWLKCAARKPRSPESVIAPDPAPVPPRNRGLRRPRFGFGVNLPGTQVAGDTTDLAAFGVPLKLVASQDVGGRDRALLDAIVVDDHESAAIVERVLAQSLTDLPGAQAITDQGTPYLAEQTRAALESMGVEHAPQKEADPIGKATIERAFGTLKSIAAPILSLTDRIAARVPSLRDAILAKAATTLLITALLRAYQAGARAAHAATEARGTVDEATLARLAEESRERARAHERSARLLLEHVHELYGIDRAQRTFVNSLRSYPTQVLHEAEYQFRSQVHRDDIRDRASYFAAIVRRCNDDYQRILAVKRANAQIEAARREQEKLERARDERRRADPVAWLHEALQYVAKDWSHEEQRLIFGGDFGARHIAEAFDCLADMHPLYTACDIARGAMFDFHLAHHLRLGAPALEAIDAVFAAVIDARSKLRTTPRFTSDGPAGIFRSAGNSALVAADSLAYLGGKT